MKRRLTGVLVGLAGGSAIVAVLLFVVGAPWLAGLNPYYRLADWSSADTTRTGVTATVDARGRQATLLSAFFGVDGGLPPVLRVFFCPFAPGRDGMPVVFSHELDTSSVQAADFRVVSRSGNVTSPVCTTFMPASDAGELRTALAGLCAGHRLP
jgi:hypothetical protein